MDKNMDVTQHSEEARAAWLRQALAQGTVCVVCGTPPQLHRRGVFYDTGLCIRCEVVVQSEAPAAS